MSEPKPPDKTLQHLNDKHNFTQRRLETAIKLRNLICQVLGIKNNKIAKKRVQRALIARYGEIDCERIFLDEAGITLSPREFWQSVQDTRRIGTLKRKLQELEEKIAQASHSSEHL
ncbi:MAG: hypothetical protein ACFFBD_15905 [Candidatus Hodarchaeota archaeon]